MPDNEEPAPPAQIGVRMANLQISLPTGRPAVITVPIDVTDFEIIAYLSAVIAATDQLRQARDNPLVVAKVMPQPPRPS